MAHTLQFEEIAEKGAPQPTSTVWQVQSGAYCKSCSYTHTLNCYIHIKQTHILLRLGKCMKNVLIFAIFIDCSQRIQQQGLTHCLHTYKHNAVPQKSVLKVLLVRSVSFKVESHTICDTACVSVHTVFVW